MEHSVEQATQTQGMLEGRDLWVLFYSMERVNGRSQVQSARVHLGKGRRAASGLNSRKAAYLNGYVAQDEEALEAETLKVLRNHAVVNVPAPGAIGKVRHSTERRGQSMTFLFTLARSIWAMYQNGERTLTQPPASLRSCCQLYTACSGRLHSASLRTGNQLGA